MSLIEARYADDADRIERGLNALAMAGDNSITASQLIGISDSTLRNWRLQYPDRYREIREQRAPELERLIAQESRALAARYGQLEAQALEEASKKIEGADLKDLGNVFKNASIAKGVNIDKTLLLEGRPTQLTVALTGDDVLRSLEAKGYIDSTVAEIESA